MGPVNTVPLEMMLKLGLYDLAVESGEYGLIDLVENYFRKFGE